MRKIVSLLVPAIMLYILPVQLFAQDFAFDLLSRIANDDKGDVIFISPASVSAALAMTANGADGLTRSEILSAIGEDGSMKTVNAYFRKDMKYLTKTRKGITLDIANSLWISDDFDMKRAFSKTLKKYFSANASVLDFGNPASVDIINRWCADNTAGRIDKMLDNISPDDVLYIMNAIYFKGMWTRQFNPSNSFEDNFFGTAGTSKVKFMNDKAHYPFFIGDNASMLELHYGDGSMAMDIVLPAKGCDIEEFVAGFKAEAFEEMLKNMSTEEVCVMMPAFNAEYEINLNSVLQSLGIISAFTSSADFSNLSNSPLAISKVIQKTFIEVNEEGSEAAAVTSVGIMRTSLGPEPYRFTVNRPFVFFIRDTATNVILFTGLVRNV